MTNATLWAVVAAALLAARMPMAVAARLVPDPRLGRRAIMVVDSGARSVRLRGVDGRAI